MKGCCYLDMSRIVKSKIQPTITSVIQTIKNDGSIDSIDLKKNDIVTDLRYVDSENISKVTGRVANFTLDVSKKVRTYTSNPKSFFSEDVKLTSLEIDASQEYKSNIITVPAREIIENENVTDVKRMKYYVKYGVSFEISLTDGTLNTFEIQEGQTVVGLTYLNSGSEDTVTCKVIAINHDRNLGATALVVMIDDAVKEIPIRCVKNIEKTVDPITLNESISDAIKNTTDGFVSISAGTFTDDITIEKDMIIYGARAGQSASTKNGMKSTVDETIIAGNIKVSSGVSITLDGVTLTDKALINVSGAKDITIKNCKILGLTPTSKKTFVVRTDPADETKVIIKNCYFGENPRIEKDGFEVYNLLELNGALKDGSEFSNNYFVEGCSNHNDINIYQVEEGATIRISNNTWEKSANAIRLGIKGEPSCTIDVINNTYMTTDSNKEYAGLICIQPYAKETTSMANTTIKITGTSYKGPTFSDGTRPQTYYMYAGKNDMQFTEENVPTIIFNGRTVLAPIKK